MTQFQNFEFQLSASNSMDIFISADPLKEPSDLANSDLEVTKTTRFTLRSASLPGFRNFVAAVRINGANQYYN